MVYWPCSAQVLAMDDFFAECRYYPHCCKWERRENEEYVLGLLQGPGRRRILMALVLLRSYPLLQMENYRVRGKEAAR